MVKYTWCVLCLTLVVVGCSSDAPQETSFQDVDSADTQLGSASALDSGDNQLGEAAPMPIGDECGSPALLDGDASAQATRIDDLDVAAMPPALNDAATTDDELDAAELPPPSFVPPLSISAMSRAQSDAAATDEDAAAEETTVTAPVEADIVAETEVLEGDVVAELPALPEAEGTTPDPFASPNPPTAFTPPAIPLEVAQPSVPEVPVDDGFSDLIAADGTFAGWEVVDGKLEAWESEDGILRCIGSGGGWLQTVAPYSDFVLRGEYRLSAGANTGIAVRFPGEGNPSLSGIEVQLLDETADKYAALRDIQRTGSLYYLSAADVPVMPQPIGEWNTIEIVCRGRQMQVTLNGMLINTQDFDVLDQSTTGQRLSERAPLGRIALQSHESPVEFRNLEIRDLVRETESGLKIVDVIEGAGDVARPGMNVTVHYVGQFLSGEIFDDSYTRGEAVTVPIDKVLLGWREGIRGMQVGGRRRLIVPPQLAYGEAGVSDVIPPDSTLVFEVELLAVAAAETNDVVGEAVAPESTESVDVPEATVEDIAPPAENAAVPTTSGVSSPLLAPPTQGASQSRQMPDPLNDSSLFDDAAVEEPRLLPTDEPQLLPTTTPATAISPVSSTQPGEPQPLHTMRGPRF